MNSQINILLKKDDGSQFRVLADQVSPRGCTFQWTGKDLEVFRENNKLAGKFCCFNLEMRFTLPSLGEVFVATEGQVAATHRCTQDEFQIKLNFNNMQQDGYRLLAEYIANQQVTVAASVNAEAAHKVTAEVKSA